MVLGFGYCLRQNAGSGGRWSTTLVGLWVWGLGIKMYDLRRVVYGLWLNAPQRVGVRSTV